MEKARVKTVQFKRNGNDITSRRIDVEKINEFLATDKKKVFCKVGGLWYEVEFYNEQRLPRIIKLIGNDPEKFLTEALEGMIHRCEYIHAVNMELCKALGINIKRAEGANQIFQNTQEAKRKADYEKRLKYEEEQRKEEEARIVAEIEKAENDVIEGKKIEAEMLIFLCKKYLVYIHPRTVHTLNEFIVELNGESCSILKTRKKLPKLSSACEAYKNLQKEIKAFRDPEIQAFLGGKYVEFK